MKKYGLLAVSSILGVQLNVPVGLMELLLVTVNVAFGIPPFQLILTNALPVPGRLQELPQISEKLLDPKVPVPSPPEIEPISVLFPVIV